jgi:TolB protein
MMRKPSVATFLAVGASLSLLAQAPTPAPAPPPTGQTPPPQQGPSEIILSLKGEPGAPPRYAVPDLIALSNDPETVASAKLIAQVLWDDLTYEREFYLIPRDTYASIPAARSVTDVPFDQWRELGADGLFIGTVQKVGNNIRLEARLFDIKAQRSVFNKLYEGTFSNPRLLAHTISDEIHWEQRQLRGVARTRLAFASDREGERVVDTVERRDGKEIYIADYDGANQRRLTTNRKLNISPVWSPDGSGIAYASWRRGYADIFISWIYQGRMDEPTLVKGRPAENFLPAWSPDGTKLAFMSNRDGNPEIYVINKDGTGLRRITNHPGIDTTPTWAPSGTQLAFTSDRTGSPQIYSVSAEGLNLQKLTSESYCDRPTWSRTPFNEIAYASRTGPGYDIKVLDIATRAVRQLTFGEGSNESPAFSPNGRHLAFVSTRAGKSQIFTIARDGKNLKQVTRVGANTYPNWSPSPDVSSDNAKRSR